MHATSAMQPPTRLHRQPAGIKPKAEQAAQAPIDHSEAAESGQDQCADISGLDGTRFNSTRCLTTLIKVELGKLQALKVSGSCLHGFCCSTKTRNTCFTSSTRLPLRQRSCLYDRSRHAKSVGKLRLSSICWTTGPATTAKLLWCSADTGAP